jgi:hypothetical protein
MKRLKPFAPSCIGYELQFDLIQTCRSAGFSTVPARALFLNAGAVSAIGSSMHSSPKRNPDRSATMPLQWSEPRAPGDDDSRYDHVVAETPLGRIVLEWKSWKESDNPCGQMPWGEFVVGWNLDEAKVKAQEAWNKMVPQVAALSG